MNDSTPTNITHLIVYPPSLYLVSDKIGHVDRMLYSLENDLEYHTFSFEWVE